MCEEKALFYWAKLYDMDFLATNTYTYLFFSCLSQFLVCTFLSFILSPIITGPVCYKKGGPLAVTDANLVLGRLLPHYFPKIFGPQENEPLDKDSVIKAFKKITNEVSPVLSLYYVFMLEITMSLKL